VAVLGAIGLLGGAAVLTWRWVHETPNSEAIDAVPRNWAGTPVVESVPAPDTPSSPEAVAKAPEALELASVPPYVVESPDVIFCDVHIGDPTAGKQRPLPDQPISGQHLVRPDGSINLGRWGTLAVSGMTCDQIAKAIREKVTRSESFQALKLAPEAFIVVVDVAAYNSKAFYVVVNEFRPGESIHPFPAGRMTVVDAISQVKDLPVEGIRKVWVARPAAVSGKPPRILHVDWAGIKEKGIVQTNYKLLPSDRLYVEFAN
jgi:polysaccharide export outer membrane protein